MKFTKMQGAGNDFLVINNIEEKLPQAQFAALARRLCTRRMSIGADGMMIVDAPQNGGDYRMYFYNADGSLGEMCGNGARCIARYGYEKGLAGETQRVETTAGLVVGQRRDKRMYTVRLNDITKFAQDVTAKIDGKTVQCDYLELGDPGLPHAVVLLEGDCAMTQEALRELGRKLRANSAFPKGANVNFCQVIGENEVEELTYERGVEDFTLACGTGAGSLAAVLTASGRMDGANVQVQTAGGDLDVEVEMEAGRVENLYLTGAALIVYSGELAEEFLQPVVIEDIMD